LKKKKTKERIIKKIFDIYMSTIMIPIFCSFSTK